MTLLVKAVRRETQITVRDRSKRRNLIVTLLPGDVIELRAKGTRKAYVLDIETVYQVAMKIEADHVRRAKDAARKSKKAIGK